MKINALIIVFSLFCLALSGQVDKTAITEDFIRGHEKDSKELEPLKKHFSPNMKMRWHNGNVWPDGSEGSLDKFWNAYTKGWRNYKHEMTDIEVREINNETYAFYTWTSTPVNDKQHPDWAGTATGPAAVRLIWEEDKIKQLHFYVDTESRQKQHAAVSKK